ncbi:MAG: hypothetical protein MUF30_08265 [Burkholderiales bacterium]|nr:hypothetical protein [Burkholderiales bacterium]
MPLRAVLLLALLPTLLPTAVRAQAAPRSNAEPEQLVDWYYASTFGTGVYRIGDRTVTVLRLPLSTVLREPGDDTWGVRLKLPVTFGLYNLSTVVEDIANRNLATIGAMPGVEFEKEVAHNWVLKPTASLGGAFDASRGDRSSIWEVGVRSVWSRSFRRVDFSLGNALLYAGNVARDGVSQNYGVVATGVNFIVPTGGRVFERVTNLGFHAVHYAFFNRIEFLLGDRPPRALQHQFELALTFGTYQPVRVFGFAVDRLGIGVRFGEEFYAVRLISGFLY